MLGSDYPFAIGSMEAAVACIEALALSAEQKETIFSGNALKLLR
jgi:predicted TIM-barrel fold metal-dependent hydrolase